MSVLRKKRTFVWLMVVAFLVIAGIIGKNYFRAQNVFEEVVRKVVEVDGLSGDDLYESGRDILGFEGERVYLILFQNYHELRPTGGFIGTYGVLRVENGKINEFFTQDSGLLDEGAPVGVPVPRAPLAMSTYLNQGFQFFRDANWQPDFSDSARILVQTYALEGGKHSTLIDGVIAIDPEVLITLLKSIGSVTIDGVTFTDENVVDTLEYEVEVAYKEKGIPEDKRKDIVNKLGAEIIKRVQDTSSFNLLSFLVDVKRLAKEKHILLFSFDDKVQSIYTHQGWSGDADLGSGDFVRIVDANLNALKTDRVIDRSINYSIEPFIDGQFESGFTGTLDITYTHSGERDYRTRDYRSYTRVYLPFGSVVTSVSPRGLRNEKGDNGFDLFEENDALVVGFYNTLDLQKEETITIKYRLSESVVKSISDNLYSFRAIKQPGTQKPGLTINWHFDKQIENSIGPGRVQDRTQYVFDGDLREDRAFEIRMK